MPLEKTPGKKLKFVGAGMKQRKHVDKLDDSDGLHRISGPSSLQPDVMAEEAELRECLISIIQEVSISRGETLDHAEQNFNLLCMHYGIDSPPMTYRAIEEETGIPASSLAQRIPKLLSIIRKNKKYSAILEDYR